MMYSKSQLNAISRRYAEINRQRIDAEIRKMKEKESVKYSYFVKSKYKTLLGFQNFLKRINDNEKAYNIIDRQVALAKKKQAKLEIENEKKRQRENAELLERATQMCNNMIEEGVSADDIVNFLNNYTESYALMQYRKKLGLSFKNFRRLLEGGGIVNG